MKSKKWMFRVLLLLPPFISMPAFSQIVVDDTPTGDELAASLVGVGVEIFDVVLDCPTGASGLFECIDCNVGMASGIVLTSGGATIVEGPNNSGGAGLSNGAPGDADLEDYIDDPTNDACILEFDMTVTSDSLQFNYVFGSDEYLEYVFSFNDGFAFFISGPGIVGTENLALVPGTTDPVTIDNVNTTVNPEFYVDNGTGWVAPYSTDPYYIQYDGFTTVLTASRLVQPCETYHLKMVVADAVDGILDSGVFIQAGSLSSPGVTIAYDYEIEDYPEMIEGCNNGEVSLSLSFPALDTLVVNLIIEGTAGNGLDYSTIPTSIIFYPGDSVVIIPIEAYEDGLAEGVETIIISGELLCGTLTGDSIILYIADAFPLDAWPADTLICPGETVNLQASGATTYLWTPEEGLDITTGESVFATPEFTTSYTVTGTFYSCVDTRTLTITVEEPSADAGSDVVIYSGGSTDLEGLGGVIYEWSPPDGLSDPNISDPVASPDENTTYILAVTTELGCTYYDTVNVVVLFDPQVYIPNAFTPNGDGLHDFLNVLIFNEVTPLDFSIFDRWGELVFRNNDLSSAWNGQVNGIDQEIGTYMYIFVGLDERGNEFTLKGTIALLR